MPLLIVRTLGELAAFALCALVLGSWLVALVRRVARVPSDEAAGLREAAVRMLAGMGAIAYTAAALGLVHALRWWVLAALGGAVLVAGRQVLLTYGRVLHLPRGDRLALAATGLATAMASGQLLASLAPPEAYDELAYHLPIARAIESGHAAQQLLHAHDAYGNLPALGECLYAAALSVGGTALAHSLQLTALLAFVVLAAAIVREQCGARAGAAVAVALLAYPDLTYLGTTSYVDALATAFEVAALLLALRWIERDSPADLLAAALLLGFALSVKYTALFTAAALVVLVGMTAWRRGATRLAVAAGAITVAACGLWYGKNLVRFGNPFWPFYLGHRTMDDRTYADFVRGIHAFGPRTLRAFVEFPWHLATDSAVVPFVALSVVGVAFFVRRSHMVALYALVFMTYWFWIASHQVRFLLSGGAAAIVAVTVAFAAGGRRTRGVLAVAAAVAVIVVQLELQPFSGSAAGSAVTTQFGAPKAGYAVGLESTTAYFHHYTGCTADAVAYLDMRPALSPVLVPQTVLAPWFARHAQFGKLPVTTGSPRAARSAFRRGGFHAVLLRSGEPENLGSSPAATAAVRALVRPVWRRDGCTILAAR